MDYNCNVNFVNLRFNYAIMVTKIETNKTVNEKLKGRHFSPSTEFKKGHIHSLDARRKMSTSHKGKKLSNEHKNNIAKSLKGITKGRKCPWTTIRNLNNNPMKDQFVRLRASTTRKDKIKSGEIVAWNKGRKMKEYEREIWMKTTWHNKERNMKISQALTGKKRSLENIKKQANTLKMLYSKGILQPNKTAFRKGHKRTEDIEKRWLVAMKSLEHRKLLVDKRKGRVIPVKDTSIEIKIQNFLKELGIEFFTHQYMKEIEHGYQCDILIPSINLVIECDGVYWHKYPIGREIDHIRTKELIEKGFKVLRLWENDIKVMDLNEFKSRLSDL